MREISSEELRDLQMQILDYVDAFCKENDIKYTLSGGTLLGAVRHGGFIPWDDDMDIQMLRKEYNRFVALWNERNNHGNYSLVCIESGNGIGCPFGKVCDVRTITISGNEKQTGVFVDVFPVDNVIDQHDFYHRHKKILRLYKKKSIVCEYENLKAKRTGLLRRIVLFVRKPNKDRFEIAKQINDIACQFEHVKCDHVFEMIAGAKCKAPMPITVFDDYCEIGFENRKYMSVKDVDLYLTQTFGNYRELPPKEKQVKTHDFIPYWI